MSGRNILIDALYYQDEFLNYVVRITGKKGKAMEEIQTISKEMNEVPENFSVKTLEVRI